jgi:CO/xanthine dehydrogenase Mo-binding subunit
LDQYQLALSKHMPTMVLDVLPVDSRQPHPKGIAEAVMCSVAPAIGNAIAHATGKRFRDLPLTPERILARLKQP